MVTSSGKKVSNSCSLLTCTSNSPVHAYNEHRSNRTVKMSVDLLRDGLKRSSIYSGRLQSQPLLPIDN